MLNVFEVAPFVRSHDTALALLRSSVKGETGPRAWSRFSPDRTFSLSDISGLIESRRCDLAEMILEGCSDVGLLASAAAVDSWPASVLKAVCRNSETPVMSLLSLYGNSRKAVQSAARSQLASRLGVMVKDADPYIEVLSEVASCPSSQLRSLVVANSHMVMPFLTAAVVRVALARPSGVPADVRQALLEVDSSTARTVFPHSAASLRVLCESGGLSAAELETLLELDWLRADRNVLVDAALARSTEFRPDQLRGLFLEYNVRRWGPDQFAATAKMLSPEIAEEFFWSGERVLILALLSGQLSDASVRRWVEQWLAAGAPRGGGDLASWETYRGAAWPGSPLFSSLLSSEAVSGDLLSAVLGAASASRETLAAVARNPNLSVEQQLHYVESGDSILQSVASNPRLRPEAVEALIECMVNEDVGTSSRLQARWIAKSTAWSLLANESVAPEAKLRVPLSLLSSRSYADDLGALVRLVDAELGSDATLWLEFLTLSEQWEGSLGSLVSAVRTL